MSSARQRNVLIGQSGGATAVINASLVGAFEAAYSDARAGEIYGMHYGIEGLLKEELTIKISGYNVKSNTIVKTR